MLGGLRASFYRTGIAVALLAAAVVFSGSKIPAASAALIILMISGAIGFGAGDLALYHAYEKIGPRLAVLLCQCLAVPMAIITEWVWMGTTLAIGDLGCISVILLGVLLALAPKDNPHLPPKRLLAGLLLGCIAAIGQGGGAVLSRRAYEVLQTENLPIEPIAITFIRLGTGFLFLIVWVAVTRGMKPMETTTLRRSAPWLLVNAMAGPFLGVIAYQYALSVAPSGPVLAVVATTPIMVMPLTLALDGDRMTRRALFGSVLAVAGVIGLLAG